MKQSRVIVVLFMVLLLAGRAVADGAATVPSPDPQSAKQWLEKGNTALKAGDKNGAVEAYTQALKTDPNNANVWFNRGYAYRELGNTVEAIEDITKAIEIDPKRAYFFIVRGEILNEGRDMERAILDQRAALALDPEGWQLYIASKFPAAYWMDQRRAMENYNSALERDPKNAGIYFRKMAYENENEYISDIERYSRLIKNKSHSRQFYRSRGDHHYLYGDYQSAISDYSKMIELGKDKHSYHLRGLAHYALKDWKRAKEDWETAASMGDEYAKFDLSWLAFTLEQESPGRWLLCGDLLQKSGKSLLAVAAYDKALNMDAKNVEGYKARSNAYRAMGMFGQVIGDLTKVIGLTPQSSKDMLLLRGDAYAAESDMEHALQDWEGAVLLGNEEAREKAARGWVSIGLIAMGEEEGEEEGVAGQKNVKPVQEESVAERKQKALDAYAKALKIYPDFNLALSSRAGLYFQQGDYRLAIEDYTRLIKLDPKNAELYLARAGAYAALKDENDAISDWKKAALLGSLSGPLCQDNKGLSLRWSPIKPQRNGAAPVSTTP